MNTINKYLDPMIAKLSDVLPGVLGAIIVLIIGLLLAKVVRNLITKGLNKMGLDDRVNRSGEKKFHIVKLIAMLVYYILVIYVLMIVLNLLGVGDVFAPLETMLGDFIGAIPRIVTAAVIGFAGYIIARLASEAVELLSESVNSFSTRVGFDAKDFNMIKIIKQVVFLFVFIPILIIAVDKLEMDVISGPATSMLAQFMSAIPNIIGAALILGVFYIIGRFITPALRELLSNVGLDSIPEKIGLKIMDGRSLSTLVANVAFFFIMIAGLTSALERLDMAILVSALDDVMALGGKIVFGVLIMVVGNFIARIAYNSLSASEDSAGLASIARIAILGIFFSIGLNSMGIANEIVNLAFGLTLGAVAVAIALSFGLGGREAAGKQMEHILKRFRKGE